MTTGALSPDDARVLAQVRSELLAAADESLKARAGRSFKEEIRPCGIKVATVRRLSDRILPEIEPDGIDRVIRLCEALWRSGRLEETFVACSWARAVHLQYRPEDLAVFARWLGAYVDNWASCDSLCCESVGAHLEQFGEDSAAQVTRWAASPNRWMRRGAAVSFVLPARRGLFLDSVLEVADALLEDTDDLVRKGYGWMLKAASQAHPTEVFDYLMDRREAMPRIAFRYALESMPPHLRDEAMLRSRTPPREDRRTER